MLPKALLIVIISSDLVEVEITKIYFEIMAACQTENAAKFLSKIKDEISYFSLDNKILPALTTQDIVQISGGPGSGKTELLYHLIICCLLPDTPWKGIHLGGLNKRVIFIDNDLHFNLIRFIKVLEERLKYQFSLNNYTAPVHEMSSFIDDRLKLLDIFRCSNCDKFIEILRYTETVPKRKYLLIIDGIMSFFWSNKMRMSYSSSKIPDFFTIVTSVIKNISKNHGLPVIVTKRKLMQSSNSERSMLPAVWRNLVTKQLELVNNGIIGNALDIVVHNTTSNIKIQCTISSNCGFKVCH
ncbi:rad51 domain-containing protein [Nephila pilipes]|uniref:Rad51 domain-containing protein n=1 Tax=Nephila pilipes TaxID=299642 RepID=A0A8X6NSC1_NEPPI|nr:rad51 domain-containing protein [Nephila pilipes]